MILAVKLPVSKEVTMLKFTLFIVGFLPIAVTLSCSATHECIVTSDPPGARISVNNEYQGDTPCALSWPITGRGREVTIEASKSGYVPQIWKVRRDAPELHFVLQQMRPGDAPSAEDKDLPPPPEPMPVDALPVPIKEVQPQYPRAARKAKIEGVVWVKALVDKNGRVREAIISRPSGQSVGFEEAALRAAYQNEYQPAISDNVPVAVWIAYPVRFSIKQDPASEDTDRVIPTGQQ